MGCLSALFLPFPAPFVPFPFIFVLQVEITLPVVYVWAESVPVWVEVSQGLFIIGHPIDEIVWITLTPTLSLRELTGVCKCAVSYECQSTDPLSHEGSQGYVNARSATNVNQQTPSP